MYIYLLDELIITHIDLEWTVNFEKSTLSGSASLSFKTLRDDVEEIVSLNWLFHVNVINSNFPI